eukprot:285438-Chlamydomonas_euryale.AAC.5
MPPPHDRACAWPFLGDVRSKALAFPIWPCCTDQVPWTGTGQVPLTSTSHITPPLNASGHNPQAPRPSAHPPLLRLRSGHVLPGRRGDSEDGAAGRVSPQARPRLAAPVAGPDRPCRRLLCHHAPQPLPPVSVLL